MQELLRRARRESENGGEDKRKKGRGGDSGVHHQPPQTLAQLVQNQSLLLHTLYTIMNICTYTPDLSVNTWFRFCFLSEVLCIFVTRCDELGSVVSCIVGNFSIK